MLSFRLEFPPGTPLINANGREHWSKRMKVTRNLRELSCVLARQQKIPLLREVDIRAIYYPPDRRRRDAPNILILTTKACIDGLVDAGVIADDSDKYVRSLTLVPGREIVKTGQLVIEVTEVGDA